MGQDVYTDDQISERQLLALELAAALGEVATSVSATLDQAVIFERIFDMLGRFVPYDSSAILLLRDGVLTVAAARGFPAHPPVRDVVLPYHANTTHYPVLAEGRALWLRDARTHPGWQVVPGYELVRSWIGTPLSVEGQVIGMLTIDKWEPDSYTSEHATLAQAFASHVAIAIRNAQLYEQSQRAYAELRRTQAEMLRLERMRVLGELASGVAHDFNNILAGIYGNIHLVLESVSDPWMRAELEAIARAAQDGAATVRQLQDFARVGPAGTLHPHDLRDAAEAALALTRPRWQARATQLQVLTEFAPAVAKAEGVAVRQALANLILNALDAMPEGGTLRIVTGTSGAEAFVRVQDTGVGIVPTLQPRIFEPFVTTKGAQGNGMGLTMSQAMIVRQGGRITVESAPGTGSVFTIWLPREGEHPPSPLE
jgi:signal transduction histidine kinase